MPVKEDLACYNMDHEYRGIAVIINNDIFEGAPQSFPMRNCSVKDVIDLQTILLHMDFEVLIWNNLYHDELTYRIEKLAEKDHSKNDCLVVVVMTYGINSSFIYARESLYKVEYLWNIFTSDKCPTLAGKPKMFFIQVIHGEQLDYDVILKSETNIKVCSSNTVYTNPKKVPKYADLLIVISTYDGYFPLNHPNHGSWFIQSLCFELIINDLATIDILRIMTRVSLRVILDYESFNPESSMLYEQKQIPSIKSTLVRDVYFRSKLKPLPKPAIFEVMMMESSQDENVPLGITPEKEEEDILSVSVEEGVFYDDDDEVFLDDIQSLEMAATSVISSRMRERQRRTSDVIDSVGEATSPAHTKRHSFPSTSGEVYSATRVMIIRDTNRTRRAELTSELVDQGYSSPGGQSSARSLRESWFQYSAITTNNDADAIDAKPMTSQSETKSSYVLTVPNKITEMVVSKDAICYNMDHQYRGLAVIINNDIFERTSLPDRIGSLKDVNDLASVFFEMDFEVLVWNNMYQDEIHERIKKLALEDHSKNDCLIVVVMTHGMTSSFVYARENPYPVENLWEAFTPDKCPTLAGKPKMFFVQACRGEKLDCGVTLYKEITQVDSSSPTYKLPTYADFMIAFSTYDGYYSFRHPDNGTWFIQSLCFELNKHDLATTDMLTIMTRVSRRVALDYESYHPVISWLHQQKQIPVVHSMLIRDVFFKPKKFPPPEPVFIEGR